MPTGTRAVFVVSWDEDEAIDLASRLSEAGWIVALEHADANKAWKRIKDAKPEVVVVDMSRRPAHSKELLRLMGQRKYTSGIPIVELNGDDGVSPDTLVDAVESAATASR